MSLINEALLLAVKEQAAVAAAYLDLDAPESDETRENAIAIYSSGAMPLLMPHLSSEIDGMRAATSRPQTPI